MRPSEAAGLIVLALGAALLLLVAVATWLVLT